MKSFLFILQQAPHASALGQEGLDALMMGSAFAPCSVLFMAEGLFQIQTGQNTQALGTKAYGMSYGALADYGVEQAYVRESDLTRFGLQAEALEIPVQVIADDAVAALLQRHDLVLNY